MAGIDAPSCVFVAGATGTIGRAVSAELVARGYHVVVLARRCESVSPAERVAEFPGVEVELGECTDRAQLSSLVFSSRRVRAVVSCLASRTGFPDDAWSVDYQAHRTLLDTALAHGVEHFVLLSALCLQKPKLEFQHAKLAFEDELKASGMRYSIVRPTAYFKSLSGQLKRVRAGKPYLLVGDGEQTACKPISDADLARFLANCLTESEQVNRTLPIGGPGPALTPKAMGELVFQALETTPRFKRIPRWFFTALVYALRIGGAFSRSLRAKAELAAIGRYYATESMLVWDPQRQLYDEEATPSFGQETLDAYYRKALLKREPGAELGAHSVFD